MRLVSVYAKCGDRTFFMEEKQRMWRMRHGRERKEKRRLAHK